MWLVIVGLIFYFSGNLGIAQSFRFHSLSQSFHSAAIDTNLLLSDRSLKSPWGAVARSAIIPGWGQVYTEHYIKGALAFSLNSFMIYQIYRYEQKWREDQNQAHREKRNLYTWYFGLTYLLTLVDAYVDAYLFKFDTAMEISHYLELEEGLCYSGIRFTYHF